MTGFCAGVTFSVGGMLVDSFNLKIFRAKQGVSKYMPWLYIISVRNLLEPCSPFNQPFSSALIFSF